MSQKEFENNNIPAGQDDTYEIPTIAVYSPDTFRDIQEGILKAVQSEDTNPIDRALGYKRLTEQFGMSVEDLARSVGKEAPPIQKSLDLLSLPQEIQEGLIEGILTEAHVRPLIHLNDPEMQVDIYQELKEDRKQELITRVQSGGIDPITRAGIYEDLIEKYTMNQEELATQLGIPTQQLKRRIALLSLPLDIKIALVLGEISEGNAYPILSLGDRELQLDLFNRLVKDIRERKNAEALSDEDGEDNDEWSDEDEMEEEDDEDEKLEEDDIDEPEDKVDTVTPNVPPSPPILPIPSTLRYDNKPREEVENMSFDYKKEIENLARSRQQSEQAAKDAEKRLVESLFTVLQRAQAGDMLRSVQRDPWHMGQVEERTNFVGDTTKDLFLVQPYDILGNVETGTVGYKNVPGHWEWDTIYEGESYGRSVNKHWVPTHDEPVQGLVSWSRKGRLTGVGVGVSIEEGRPYFRVYDLELSLEGAPEEIERISGTPRPYRTNPYESKLSNVKIFSHKVPDSTKDSGINWISSSSIPALDASGQPIRQDLLQTFIKDHLLVSSMRRQQRHLLPADLIKRGQEGFSQMPPGKEKRR